MTSLITFGLVVFYTVVEVGFIAALLTLLPRMGQVGRKIADVFAHAPMLDVWVALLTWVPWLVAAICAGWIGLAGSVVGEIIVLGGWCMLHEMMHREAAQGPRIVKFLNRTVGRWQNHLALWITMIALPGFWLIRILQITLYWTLIVLLGFPRYKQAEWINVSRHKFDGLIGHDLLWCLYCDWMTGVYSLGAEMLRNVESFWCPIRFYDGKKCENCRVDFPDIEHGWVPASGNMQDVDKVMQEKYTQTPRAWFGHPVRMTVNGKSVESNVQ